MRGLMTKDLEFMKENAKAYVAAFAIAFLCFASTSAGPSFLISYVSILIAVIAWNNISNDEMYSSMAYLFTLPFSRREYVKEKYLFGTGMILLGWALAVIIGCVVNIAGYRSILWEEMIAAAASGLCMALVAVSVMFPVQLKFGSQAGRIALFIMVFGAMAVYWIGSEICDRMQIDLSFVKEVMEKILSLGIPVCLVLLGALMLLMLLLSCTISIKIMEKKEY